MLGKMIAGAAGAETPEPPDLPHLKAGDQVVYWPVGENPEPCIVWQDWTGQTTDVVVTIPRETAIDTIAVPRSQLTLGNIADAPLGGRRPSEAPCGGATEATRDPRAFRVIHSDEETFRALAGNKPPLGPIAIRAAAESGYVVFAESGSLIFAGSRSDLLSWLAERLP